MPQLLLLTGIPGTGKTVISNYLAEQHGFLHFDREAFEHWSKVWQFLWERAPKLFLWLALLKSQKIVISWGFLPGADDRKISQLQALGFVLIWLDGDRAAARREFLERGTVPERKLDAQLARIARLDLFSLHPIILSPFDRHGLFFDKAVFARQLIHYVKSFNSQGSSR
jgi:hypothetical protein